MTVVSSVPHLVDGRYRLGEVLGTGGAAVVRRAYDERLRRDVAVKLFHPGTVDDQRHNVDLTLMASLADPAIVRMYDGGQVVDGNGGHSVYLVMELVPGPTLQDALERDALTRTDVAVIGADLAAALTYLHGQGVVHRDVNPRNVLLSLSDHVSAKLDGVGVVQVADTRMRSRSVGYLSPEQARGEAVGPPSDIYSLGLVLLTALTALTTRNGAGLAGDRSESAGPPVIPATLGPSWSHLLGAMLAADPAVRPDATRVRRDLAALDAGTDPGVDAPAITVDGAAAREVDGPRLQTSGRVHAELTEARHGWVLTLHTDAALAEVLRANGIGAGDRGRFTVSVSPNLVPGEPFDVDQVEITVDR